MDRFMWSPLLDTGLDEVDREHRELAELVDQLAQSASGTVEASRRAADRLAEATRRHFVHEERLMDETGYPMARRHRAVHAALLDRIDEMRARLRNGHGWHASTMALFTEDFLIHHVDQEDRALAAHVRKRRAAPPLEPIRNPAGVAARPA